MKRALVVRYTKFTINNKLGIKLCIHRWAFYSKEGELIEEITLSESKIYEIGNGKTYKGKTYVVLDKVTGVT